MRPLWAGDPKNLHNSFFVKNFYLDLNFFEVLQIALLKNEKKNFSKKDASHLKLLDIARYKRKALKKKKEKQKKRKSQTTAINVFLLFLWENIFWKTTFVWWLLEIEQSNSNAGIDMHWSYRRSISNQNTWQQTSYFSVDVDSNGLLFLFSYTPEKCLQFSKKTKAFVKKHF